MRVLAACERSGKVRDAFRMLGAQAFSCDLKESAGEYTQFHHQGDIMSYLMDEPPFDLIIMFPECTAMATSGNRTYGLEKSKSHLRIKAINWTIDLWKLAKSRAKFVCLENPRSVIFQYLRADIQVIQPWMFGHPENKETHLALHKLPRLLPTYDVRDQMKQLIHAQQNRVHWMGASSKRKQLRSETFDGVAEAMASQWINLC